MPVDVTGPIGTPTTTGGGSRGVEAGPPPSSAVPPTWPQPYVVQVAPAVPLADLAAAVMVGLTVPMGDPETPPPTFYTGGGVS